MFIALAISVLMLAAEPKDQREVKFNLPAEYGFPTSKKLVLVKAGTPGPGQPKHQAVAETAELGKSIKLPDAGPFDIWWVPTHDGMATRILSGESFKESAIR